MNISVVISTFEYVDFFELALRSAQEQTAKPHEIIVIDDGSGPVSLGKIKNIVAKNRRRSKIPIRFYSRPHLGISKTLNFGLALAQGDWIAILDSDDYYLLQRLERLSQFGSDLNLDFVFSDFQLVDPKGVMLKEIHHTRPDLIAMLAAKRSLAHGDKPDFLRLGNVVKSTSNFFFRKTLLKTIGGFRDFRLFLDYEFLVRASLAAKVGFCKEALLVHRINHRSYSNFQFDRAHLELEKIEHALR